MQIDLSSLFMLKNKTLTPSAGTDRQSKTSFHKRLLRAVPFYFTNFAKSMKVIRNDIIPFGKGYGAINLFGILFAKHNMAVTPEVINHEMIHSRQMRELLYLPFYIIYVIEWLINIVRYGGNTRRAYYNIAFEREAYRHGNDLDYLSHRRHFAQWRKQ